MKTRNEAGDFFRNDPALKQLFGLLAKRFEHNGKLSGTVAKANFKDPGSIMALLGIGEVEWHRSKRLKVEDVLTAYAHTPFAEIPIEEAVSAVIQRPLMTNLEKHETRQKLWGEYQLAVTIETPIVDQLLTSSQRQYYFSMHKFDLLLKAERLMNALPHEPMVLPQFAFEQLGDPHALEKGTSIGTLLTNLLSRRFKMPARNAQDFFNLYLKANLVPDSTLNFVTVQNLTAENDVFQAASKTHMIWNVPIMTVLSLSAVLPAVGNRMYLIENSSVFAILATRFPHLPLIMTSGRYSAAVWTLLDRFPDDVELYYASDMDASGLSMAEGLWARYPGRVHLWGMSTADFEAASRYASIDSEAQMKQIAQISMPELMPVRALMIAQRRKVYQEGIIDQLAQVLEDYDQKIQEKVDPEEY